MININKDSCEFRNIGIVITDEHYRHRIFNLFKDVFKLDMNCINESFYFKIPASFKIEVALLVCAPSKISVASFVPGIHCK